MYQNITSATTTVLTTLDAVDGENGYFDLRIANYHASAVPIISLYLTDGTTDFYIINAMKIPVSTAVTFPTKHDTGEYSLKLVTSGTTTITLMRIYD